MESIKRITQYLKFGGKSISQGILLVIMYLMIVAFVYELLSAIAHILILILS